MSADISVPLLQNKPICASQLPYTFSSVDFSVQVFENDFMALFPECFCILCVLVLIVYGVVITTSSKHAYPIALSNIAGLSILTLFYAIFLVYNSPFRNAVFYTTVLS